RLEEQKVLFRKYSARAGELARDVAGERRDLPEAAEELSAYLRQIGYDPVPVLRANFGDLDRQALLAAKLVRDVGFLSQDCPEVRDVHPLERLARAYHDRYRSRLPAFAREA